MADKTKKIHKEGSFFQGLRAKVIYWFRRKYLTIKNAWRYLLWRLWLNERKIWRIVFLVSVLVVICAVERYGNYPLIPQEKAGGFFFALGAMAGTILAILFSLNLFVQQTATEKYSAGLFDSLSKNQTARVIYFGIGILILLLFSAGVLFDSSIIPVWFYHNALILALLLLGVLFVAVDILYQNTTQMINPKYAIQRIVKDARKLLKKYKEDAELVAWATPPQDGEDKNEKIRLAAAFVGHSHYLSGLDRQLENIFDISRKLADRNELTSSIQTLYALIPIFQDLIRAREGTFIRLPAQEFILATKSDIHSLLTKNLERLLASGENYIRTRSIVGGANEIPNIFFSLADTTKDAKFIGHLYGNEILETISGYMGQYIRIGIKADEPEIAFSGANALRQAGKVMVEKNMPEELYSIYRHLYEIGIYGLSKGGDPMRDPLMQEVFSSFIEIIREMVRKKYFSVELQVSKLFEYLRSLTVLFHAQLLAYGGLESRFSAATVLNKPYNEIVELLIGIGVRVKDFPKKEREDIKSIFLTITEEYRRLLRSLSEQVKSADTLLMSDICNGIYRITAMLLHLAQDNFWREDRKKLLEQAGWYAHSPYWFVRHAETFSDNNAFDTLTDSVAKIGAESFNTGNIDLVKGALEELIEISHLVLQKANKEDNPFGNMVPEILSKASMLGIIALKRGEKELVETLKKSLLEFHEKYKKEYLRGFPKGRVIPLNYENPTLYEIWRLRDEIDEPTYRGFVPLHEFEEMVSKQITTDDIDAFTRKVWGRWQDGKTRRLEPKGKRNK